MTTGSSFDGSATSRTLWPPIAIPAFLVTAAAVATGATASAAHRNGLIAYTECCGPAGIYVIRADGTGRRRVYAAVHDDSPLDPSWSPDGRRLAFVPGAPRRGVWVMEPTGRGQRRITSGTGDALFRAGPPTARQSPSPTSARRARHATTSSSCVPTAPA